MSLGLQVKLGVYAFYFKAVGIMTGILALAGSLLYQAFLVSTNLWLSKWTSDNTTVVNGTQDMAKTHMYLTVYGSLGIFQGNNYDQVHLLKHNILYIENQLTNLLCIYFYNKKKATFLSTYSFPFVFYFILRHWVFLNGRAKHAISSYI